MAVSRFFGFVSILWLTIHCTGNPITFDKGGFVRQMAILPAATIVRGSSYKTLGTAQGESSTFIILGLFPITRPLNIQYAMSQAVRKVEGGQSLVNLKIWHETHYYFPLGKVSVVKVEGDVVSFTQGNNQLFQDKKGKEVPGIKVKPRKKKRKAGIKFGGLLPGGSIALW